MQNSTTKLFYKQICDVSDAGAFKVLENLRQINSSKRIDKLVLFS